MRSSPPRRRRRRRKGNAILFFFFFFFYDAFLDFSDSRRHRWVGTLERVRLDWLGIDEGERWGNDDDDEGVGTDSHATRHRD